MLKVSEWLFVVAQCVVVLGQCRRFCEHWTWAKRHIRKLPLRRSRRKPLRCKRQLEPSKLLSMRWGRAQPRVRRKPARFGSTECGRIAQQRETSRTPAKCRWTRSRSSPQYWKMSRWRDWCTSMRECIWSRGDWEPKAMEMSQAKRIFLRCTYW